MPAPNEAPYIHDRAVLTITSPDIDLSCMVRNVSLVPADDDIDIETQCNQGGTAPGRTTWTFTAELLNSFDSTDAAGDGLWNQLDALAKTLVEMKLKPKNAAVDSTNPEATFQMYFPSIPFLDVQTIGEKTLIPINRTTFGAPTIATSAA